MIKPVFTIGPSPDAQALRYEVFVQEQNVVHEFDDYDPGSWSLVLYMDGLPIGTGRLIRLSPVLGQIGRVAVKKEFRHRQVGTYILRFLERKAQEIGILRLEIHAQCDKIGFYQKCGYLLEEGDVFMDEGIPHRHMSKQLQIRKRRRYGKAAY